MARHSDRLVALLCEVDRSRPVDPVDFMAAQLRRIGTPPGTPGDEPAGGMQPALSAEKLATVAAAFAVRPSSPVVPRAPVPCLI